MDVGQLIGEQELPELIPPDMDVIRPDNVWVNYDVESDTFIMYLNTRPIPGVSYYISNNVLAITSLDSDEIVGFQIEAWEKEYLLTQPKLAEWWPTVRQSLIGERSWSPQLVIMGLLLLFVSLFTPDQDEHLVLAVAA